MKLFNRRDRVVRHLAVKFGRSREEVEVTVDKWGEGMAETIFHVAASCRVSPQRAGEVLFDLAHNEGDFSQS